MPEGPPITGIGVAKDSTTRLLDEGANDRSMRVSDLVSGTVILGTAHRKQNPVSNAQPRWGKEWGRFYGAEFEVLSLSRKTGELDSTPDTLRQRGQAP